jgi:hypothetical protein
MLLIEVVRCNSDDADERVNNYSSSDSSGVTMNATRYYPHDDDSGFTDRIPLIITADDEEQILTTTKTSSRQDNNHDDRNAEYSTTASSAYWKNNVSSTMMMTRINTTTTPSPAAADILAPAPVTNINSTDAAACADHNYVTAGYSSNNQYDDDGAPFLEIRGEAMLIGT